MFLECHCGIINLAGVLISCRLEKAIVFITGTCCEAEDMGQSFTQLSFRKIAKNFPTFRNQVKHLPFLRSRYVSVASVSLVIDHLSLFALTAGKLKSS